MRFRFLSAVVLTLLVGSGVAASAEERFVGNFAEPVDGGNIDTALSSFDGRKVLIVPRAHANEAISGATRWRNVLFAVRGMKGRAPVFELPLLSPGTGRSVLLPNTVAVQNIKLMWSYEPNSAQWQSFETNTHTGSTPSDWRVQARNGQAFDRDVVYVSINERLAVGEFYAWLEDNVFSHPLVKPTPSAISPGSFIIGYQSGAVASEACSRAIPDMPLYGFVIRDPTAKPRKLLMLFSGQHPYEGQNKVALQAAVDWVLNSTSAEASTFRATYVTIVYPFVNPTGELAGLWRGTAAAPYRDTNRNWDTPETLPSRDRGIDTVIVHKNALARDIAALGLGEPFAVFDYHQNFGDHASELDYVLHSSASSTGEAVVAQRSAESNFAPYFTRLAADAPLAERESDLDSQETLRGYMIARGVQLPITFERSVYHTLASERTFGAATMKALIEPRPLEPVAMEAASQLAHAESTPPGITATVEE